MDYIRGRTSRGDPVGAGGEGRFDSGRGQGCEHDVLHLAVVAGGHRQGDVARCQGVGENPRAGQDVDVAR